MTVIKVSDIMTPDPITVEPGMSLREAAEILRGAGVSGAPVVRGGRLVGVVSTTDILEFEATSPGMPPRRAERAEWSERDREIPEEESGEEFPSAFFIDFWADSRGDVSNRLSETEEWDRLEEHTVEEVMSRDLVTVTADASVSEAARRMLDRRVHRVIVVEEDDPIGLLSAFDLVRIVADR
ncbi:MAG: CBS domain-containing protein [Gemmatimonadota bacterium]